MSELRKEVAAIEGDGGGNGNGYTLNSDSYSIPAIDPMSIVAVAGYKPRNYAALGEAARRMREVSLEASTTSTPEEAGRQRVKSTHVVPNAAAPVAREVSSEGTPKGQGSKREGGASNKSPYP